MHRTDLYAMAAWRAFAANGEIDGSLLRPEIDRAWQRARSFRVNPGLTSLPKLGTGLTATALDSNEPLRAAAAPYLSGLSQTAQGTVHAVLVASADGTVLDVLSAPSPERVFMPGVQLGEATAGSNGVGTALAEGRYIVVSGAEHTARSLHNHICQGVPLREDDGSLLGALCFTTEDAAMAARLRKLVVVSALGIEAEYRSRMLRATFAILSREADQTAQAIALLHQDLVQSHTAARLQIELGSRRIALSRDDSLFEAAEMSLASFARSSNVWRLASGMHPSSPLDLRQFVLDTVHLLQTDARTLHVDLSARVPEGPDTFPAVSSALARLVIAQAHRALRQAASLHGNVTLGLAPHEGVSLDIQPPGDSARRWALVPFSAA